MTSLTLILGPGRRWQGRTGGKWESVVDAQGNRRFTCVPSVYKEVMVPESVADGLISLADSWKEHNKRHDPRGGLHRMVKIEDVEREVGPDPQPAAYLVGTEVMAKFAQLIADAIVGAQTASATTAKKK